MLLERRLHALRGAPQGAVLGREFVTFRGLAERCAAETDVPVRAFLGGAETTALAALCARGDLAAQVRERPGLASALAATLRDLRDAGVTPDALPRSHSDLAATHRELERAFAVLENEGLFDRIGLFRLALRGARKYLARRGFARVEVHGATELVGSVGDLLARLAESLPSRALRFFQPSVPSDYSDRLRAEWPWPFTPEAVEVLEAAPALDPDGPIPEGALEVRTARSPREELEGVSRAVLALIEKGVTPSEIQIVARSLEPYAPWLEPILGGYGIPFTSSLRVPEIAWPERRAWLDLARALTRDLRRAPVVRLIQAPSLRVAPGLAANVAALAERIARESAVVRGETDWSTALAHEERSAPPVRAALERVLARLASGAREIETARSFVAAARALRNAGADLFGEESADAVRESLEAVARLDRVRSAAGAPADPEAGELDRALEVALLEAEATPFGDDEGGVRVLDAIQARALPCKHLFLIGMVHGAWPRPLSEDPFLPDSLRAGLRAQLRRPVSLRSAADAEDRFLLGLLLSQAREHVALSFPESDSAGRTQSPSALLRFLPFVAPRTDVLAAKPIPWEESARDFARPADALARAADARQASAIAARLPFRGADDHSAGIELVRRTDLLTDDSLGYDGEVGTEALVLPPSLSPSLIEELGRCPLRAFFSRLLRAGDLETPAPDELESNEAGTFVHRALDALYSELNRVGALDAGTAPAVALQRARDLLPGALDRAEDRLRARVRERHPTAWRAFRGTVARALDDFLQRDLADLLPGGIERLDTEHPVRATLRVGSDSLAIEGKIDRIAHRANGELRVGDYKTSRQFDLPLQPSRIRNGLALQIPLYARVAAELEGSANVIGEALTVPLRPERDRDDERAKERSLDLANLETLSATPLAELVGLLRRGFFPTTAHEKECKFCRYAVACRVNHPPTAARVAAYGPAGGYLELGKRGS